MKGKLGLAAMLGAALVAGSLLTIDGNGQEVGRFDLVEATNSGAASIKTAGGFTALGGPMVLGGVGSVTFGDGNATITPTNLVSVAVNNTLSGDQTGGIQTINGGSEGRWLFLYSNTIAFAWQMRTGGNIALTATRTMGVNATATLIYSNGSWRVISIYP